MPRINKPITVYVLFCFCKDNSDICDPKVLGVFKSLDDAEDAIVEAIHRQEDEEADDAEHIDEKEIKEAIRISYNFNEYFYDDDCRDDYYRIKCEVLQ